MANTNVALLVHTFERGRYVRKRTIQALCADCLSDYRTADELGAPEVRAELSTTTASCAGCAALHRAYPDSM